MANNVLNISFVSVVFSDATALNILPQDLDANMLSIEYDDNPAKTAKASFGLVRTYNFFQQVTVTINLLKTSVRFNDYQSQIAQDAILDGTATIILDNGQNIVLKDLSIGRSSYGIGDDSISSAFTITGSTDVNVGAIA